MFEYLICAICPLSGEYEPGEQEWEFLFPAFTDRSGGFGGNTGLQSSCYDSGERGLWDSSEWEVVCG